MLALSLFVAAYFPNRAPIVVDGVLCHPRRVLAKLAPGVSPREAAPAGSRLLRHLPQIGWAVYETPAGGVRDALRKLGSRPGVLRAAVDRAARLAYTPNDPMWPDQWSLPFIKADTAWDLSLGTSGPVIAVIDTGVKIDHPDLAANVYFNPGEIPGNGIDDDNNGYVDDRNGWDFAYNDNNADDVYGHGTPCAGIAAAVGDNGIGMSGVAPRARIMPLKACGDDGYFYDSMTVPAYLYAADMGARVLSMSYFSDRVSPAERDGIEYCWARNVLPVAAAGNSSSVIPYYPGAYDRTLAVAALVSSGNKAGFSNFGAWVDVAAGGTNLVGTTNSGGYTESFGGTSGATPHVAGLAALLMGANPAKTNAEIRYAIEDTATPVNQAPFGEFANYGRVDARKAMEVILGLASAPVRTPIVRYISMLGHQNNDVRYDTDELLVSRIYGRGFQLPNAVEVTMAGHPVEILDRGRDFIDFQFVPPALGPVVVKVNGATVATYAMPPARKVCFPMSEASTPSASTFGGFAQTLLADANFLRFTRQSNGNIFGQTTFHKVVVGSDTRLRFTRYYTARNASSVETVRIYDWSTASYPYGDFVAVHTGLPPTEIESREIVLTNPARFLDDERTVYVTFEATGMPAGSELRIDQLNLANNR